MICSMRSGTRLRSVGHVEPVRGAASNRFNKRIRGRGTAEHDGPDAGSLRTACRESSPWLPSTPISEEIISTSGFHDSLSGVRSIEGV